MQTFLAAPAKPLRAGLLLLGVTLAGCANPLAGGLADFGDRQVLERMAADTSFPTAAEVGLASSEVKRR